VILWSGFEYALSRPVSRFFPKTNFEQKTRNSFFVLILTNEIRTDNLYLVSCSYSNLSKLLKDWFHILRFVLFSLTKWRVLVIVYSKPPSLYGPKIACLCGTRYTERGNVRGGPWGVSQVVLLWYLKFALILILILIFWYLKTLILILIISN